MLVSYLEVRALRSAHGGPVIQARSGSARNLAQRQAATLMLIEPDAIVYVKLRALDGPLPVEGGEAFGLGFFLLEVEEVRRTPRPTGKRARASPSRFATRRRPRWRSRGRARRWPRWPRRARGPDYFASRSL
jgi:hypothetical protein